jgi:hypothetical protein
MIHKRIILIHVDNPKAGQVAFGQGMANIEHKLVPIRDIGNRVASGQVRASKQSSALKKIFQSPHIKPPTSNRIANDYADSACPAAIAKICSK